MRDRQDDARGAPAAAPGDVVEIPGAPGGSRRVLLEARYDYDKDRCLCPACGGLGMPWKGWFTCDDCLAVAVVADGRCFALAETGGDA